MKKDSLTLSLSRSGFTLKGMGFMSVGVQEGAILKVK
ncbi:hypothetical protein HPPC_02370 [Helicobacter pylori PeCan4]|nr:hypothetical protein HPPC_02370 [Helicobacter pylori PeCan4]